MLKKQGNGEKMTDIISVVVPVYNVEKYLNRCVRSIVDQSYRNLQIILVDDGSTDTCPEICDAWAKKDHRITVIHKENAGLGMARNTGIEHATGKYICFIDSDDFIDHKILEKAYLLAEEKVSDLTIFGLASADDTGRVQKTFVPQGPKNYFCEEEVQAWVLPDLIHNGNDDARCRNLSFSVCVCLFRMDLIQRTNWRLVSERDIISEDSYSLMVLYQFVNSVAILPEIGYYYCHNRKSLTQQFRADRFEKIKQFYSKSVELQKNAGYGNVVKERIARLCLAFVVDAMKQIAASDMPQAQKRECMKTVVLDEMTQSILRNLTVGCYSLKIRLLIFCIRRKLHYAVWFLVKMQVSVAQEKAGI